MPAYRIAGGALLLLLAATLATLLADRLTGGIGQRDSQRTPAVAGLHRAPGGGLQDVAGGMRRRKPVPLGVR